MRSIVYLSVVAIVTAGLGLSGLGVRPAISQEETRQRQNDDNARQREEGQRANAAQRRGGAEQATEDGFPENRAETRVAPNLRGPSDRLLIQPRWRLGVYAYNTDTGVVVTQVVPGSPADRYGFERGDTIVTVDGFQVGYVNQYLYYLGEELQRRAGPDGRVRLLVQNVRNGDLINLDVRLEGSHPRPYRGGDPRTFREPDPRDQDPRGRETDRNRRDPRLPQRGGDRDDDARRDDPGSRDRTDDGDRRRIDDGDRTGTEDDDRQRTDGGNRQRTDDDDDGDN